MARSAARRCKGTKADGSPCRASARAGSAYCFFHDPATVGEREAARRAGGRAGKTRVLPAETPDAPLDSTADVVRLLGETINQVRRGQVDPKVANTIGYLAGTLLRALEQGDLEARVEAIESLIQSRQGAGEMADGWVGEAPFGLDEEVAA